MVLIRKIRSLFRILGRNIKWKRDADYFRGKIKRQDVSSIPEGKKIILMPHSDDEWIGCSQILLHNPEDSLVVNMNMDGGDNQELHQIRRKEAEAVSMKFGYRFITVQDKLSELKEIISSENPKCVFIPCYLDWHEEHIEVMRLFQEAAIQCNYSGLVGMYQVSLPIPAGMINCGMSMTKKQLKGKWTILKQMYRTQSILPVKRFMLNEYINGGITGAYAVEAYTISEFKDWDSKRQVYLLTEEEKKKSVDNLQSIRFIRTMLQSKMK